MFSRDALRASMEAAPITYYGGFDPTAPSLHAGHLVPLLRIGDQIVVGETHALIVPAETVVIRDGRAYVVKLVDRHATPAVALERVTLGRRRNDEVEIVSGLTGAETLVEAGAGFLSDGDIVRVASTDTFQSSLIRRERTAP